MNVEWLVNFSDKTGISARLIVARLTSCQFCLTFIRVDLIQPERHHCEEYLIKNAGKVDGPWSWFNCNVNVCMYCFCSRSSQFFNCSCSKSSQVILFTPSRLKSILSHFSSSTSQFLPRDAMLSAVYAVVVCLSVCLCVCVCVCVCHTPVLYQNG